jgi:thiosulfate dehydrogenase
MRTTTFVTCLLMGAAIAKSGCGGSVRVSDQSPAPPPPAPGRPAEERREPSAKASPAEGIDVLLCDGKTQVNVPHGTPGTAIAGALMSEWLRKNPSSTWEAEERERHPVQTAADNAGLVGQVAGHTYGRITPQDVALWKAETERMATAGSRVFHSGDELGSTIGVSCDMCHPHAANTHPETYPKFQAQLGRVALLREMINWCIEHPLRGKALAADDPRMRAVEAYILAQRKGKTLEYGKH